MKYGIDEANQFEVHYQFNHIDAKLWKLPFISFIDTTIINAFSI